MFKFGKIFVENVLNCVDFGKNPEQCYFYYLSPQYTENINQKISLIRILCSRFVQTCLTDSLAYLFTA